MPAKPVIIQEFSISEKRPQYFYDNMKPMIHLLAGGPGSARAHMVTLLREALHASHLTAPRMA